MRAEGEPVVDSFGSGCRQATKVLTQKGLFPRPNPNGKTT